MKKILLFISIFAITIALTGCEAKDTTTVQPTVPPADNTAPETPPVIDDTVATPPANTLTSAIDTASIDTVFNQNFALAQEDAKTILGADSKFCFAKVSFLGGVISTKGEMDFFFENNAQIADYYWLVNFDSTQNNQKKRYLAAQRDWGTPPCTTLASPSSFASAYEGFIANGTISSSAALSSAKVDMTLIQDVWNIELFNTAGELVLSTTQTATPTSN